VGIVAAVQADLALSLVDGPPGARAEGQLVTFDGRNDRLRRRELRPRPDCRLCGTSPSIRRIEPRTYEPPACAG
jgi:hypothetical protein